MIRPEAERAGPTGAANGSTIHLASAQHENLRRNSRGTGGEWNVYLTFTIATWVANFNGEVPR